VFTNQIILEEPVETWPLVDCMISFFSGRFPLDKAIQYTKLHPEVYLVNDLGLYFTHLREAETALQSDDRL
jgi:inositol hexakisphosphate/diphosphoinositol-pentakisphosphate kinase